MFLINKRFKEAREKIEDDPHPGQFSTSKTDEIIDKIGALVRKDSRLSHRAVAEILGIDKARQIRLSLEDGLEDFARKFENI